MQGYSKSDFLTALKELPEALLKGNSGKVEKDKDYTIYSWHLDCNVLRIVISYT